MNVVIIGNCSVAAGTPKLVVTSRHDFLLPKIYTLVDGIFELQVNLSLGEFDQLRISLIDKVPVDTYKIKDTWVEITGIIIDDINLQHFIFNGKQWPFYTSEEFRKMYNMPAFYQPGTKIFLNGCFELDITTPIWKFLMEAQEKDARIS